MDVPIELEAIDMIAAALSTISLADYDFADPVSVFTRQLTSTDANGSAGVYFHSWTPQAPPQIGTLEPARGRYRFSIQTFIKASERQWGERVAAVFAKRVRTTLYRDPSLRVSLSSLREGDEPPLERASKFGVEQTEYADSPVTGGFAFLSQTEFYLETEVIA